MSSVYYDSHIFDAGAAQQELAAFKTLLDSNSSLKERKQILANFKHWPNLCALFGTYHPLIGRANLIKRELKVGAHFIADLGVRKDGTDKVCLVEFEGAKDHDIFAARYNGRKVLPWASDMEKGFQPDRRLGLGV